jgi:hypothetical protein
MKSFQKSVTWDLKAYQEFISRLPSCYRCNKARLPGERFHPHHERIGGGGGIALKPSDVYLMPLCGGCHNIRHSSAFVNLADFYKDQNQGWNLEVRNEMTKARIYQAMLENLNAFLFGMKVLKYAR